jgi:putative transposase
MACAVDSEGYELDVLLQKRRKEKCLIKFKSPQGVQKMLSLMEKVRNIFAVDVGRYVKKVPERKVAFAAACAIWIEAAQQLL